MTHRRLTMPRLRPTIFLPASMPWLASGALVEVFTLWVSMTQVDGCVARPALARAVDGLPGREIVGQVAPGDAGAVDVEDDVEDLPQVVGGGTSADPGVGAGLAPGGQPWCDQRASERSEG